MIFQRQVTLFEQLPDGGGGNRFCARENGEARIFVDRSAVRCLSETALGSQAAVSGDSNLAGFETAFGYLSLSPFEKAVEGYRVDTYFFGGLGDQGG